MAHALSTERVPRIGVAYQGDATDPASWSGVPAGLWAGLGAAGVERVAIDARFPGAATLARALHMSWAEAAANTSFALASSAVAGLAATRSRLDGAIAIGSGFALRAPAPLVTFEDLTVAQALRTEDPAYGLLSPRAKSTWRRRQGRIYERASACCATSRWTRDSIVSDYGVPKERVPVVGFGRKVPAAANHDRDWSLPRFVFAGFDWQRKGGPELLRAFSELRRQHPAATLDLVGAHPPIEIEGVKGHGPLPLDSPTAQERYLAILDRSTCMVMPSTYEPFGIAYADAGARGLPSIGTTVGGAADAIGGGGVLVHPGDDAALLDAMSALAQPDTARRLGALAAENSALLTWELVAERLLRALRLPRGGFESFAPFLA